MPTGTGLDESVEDSIKENDSFIEQMLKDAESAPETGEIVSNPVIHKGSDDVPVPMVGRVSSAGYVFIYDTQTGDRSKANRNMLPQLLRVKRPDGSTVFTTVKPPFEPKIGIYKCLLHKDSPNRKLYDEMGLPVCPAGHLSSPYQAKRHMQKRHPAEWAAIEHEREEKERAEDRELRQKMLGNPAMAQAAPLYISEKIKQKRKK